jgi:hypothetical protein
VEGLQQVPYGTQGAICRLICDVFRPQSSMHHDFLSAMTLLVRSVLGPLPKRCLCCGSGSGEDTLHTCVQRSCKAKWPMFVFACATCGYVRQGRMVRLGGVITPQCRGEDPLAAATGAGSGAVALTALPDQEAGTGSAQGRIDVVHSAMAKAFGRDDAETREAVAQTFRDQMKRRLQDAD